MPGDFIPAGPYVPEGGAAALVADAIDDGVTTVAPSQNAVFDALAGKLASVIYTWDAGTSAYVARPAARIFLGTQDPRDHGVTFAEGDYWEGPT